MKRHYKTAVFLVRLLDEEFRIWKFKFGIDPLLDLIPGLGSLLGGLISIYLVWIGWKAGLPLIELIQMFRNIIIDTFIGEVPIIGTVADALYKSNTYNLKILKKYLEKEYEEGKVINM